jgi:FMN phosphatase YigB (HAD superfamily)
LFFEDTMINVQGAQAAGWNVVRIDPKASQEEQICASLEQFKLLP